MDWGSATWGAIKRHEGDLNEDMDGDGEIWSEANVRYTAIDSDTVGSKPYLDPESYLYVQPAGSTNKFAVLTEAGDSFLATDSFSYGDFSFSQAPLAVKDVTIGSGESALSFYKVLFEQTITEG